MTDIILYIIREISLVKLLFVPNQTYAWLIEALKWSLLQIDNHSTD